MTTIKEKMKLINHITHRLNATKVYVSTDEEGCVKYIKAHTPKATLYLYPKEGTAYIMRNDHPELQISLATLEAVVSLNR